MAVSSFSHPPLRIGIAGLGTVGAGLVRLLHAHADLLEIRCGRPLVVTAVSARNRNKLRDVDLANIRWCDNPVDLAKDPEIDVICELIGGSDGIAKQLVEAALGAGKSVVTANKALLAIHGALLAAMAESKGVTLAFEAAVAGGIPTIKVLKESLASNKITGIYGILNGTCNYILTTMRETGRDFAAVLREAQRLGYAETDPSFDIDGIDAAHKLSILTSLAFGVTVNFPDVTIEGIRSVSALDIQYAEELGYRIKLLGVAQPTDYGIEQRVAPSLVPMASPLAHVEGVTNAVIAEGDFAGKIVLTGPGAGAGPTASAVAADLVDIACGRETHTFGIPCSQLKSIAATPADRKTGAYYIRLLVMDRPGVFADIAACLRDEEVSIESAIQRGRAVNDAVPLILTVHETGEMSMQRALAAIAALSSVATPPVRFRIEAL
ncbi:MAG: homoserine dehydrogenase [Alphaproteobacteria bacterium]